MIAFGRCSRIFDGTYNNNSNNHNKTEFRLAPNAIVVPEFQFFQSSLEVRLISVVFKQRVYACTGSKNL